ncbi:Lsr2 family protein [Streptomyces sp. NBC_00233]|uniref:histone-like nucleoid-structuring protein Lsr2 n=1 Tax=Streptomyces sp. NBC_00233 TaxID=2975686 RepID=UPI00224CD6B2|nr:Lsr2 family protein [Streptomyces sp. NBC_00233]MCX5233386.1 Lsr2 family protein [Streptomyces sp. NBC_00233]
MAQKHVTVYIDDITGQETSDGATHTFSIDGVHYELDLSSDSYDAMLDAFRPYLQAARRVKAGKAARKPATARDGRNASEIRQWAREQGITVSDRGRVTAEVRAAYVAAH